MPQTRCSRLVRPQNIGRLSPRLGGRSRLWRCLFGPRNRGDGGSCRVWRRCGSSNSRISSTGELATTEQDPPCRVWEYPRLQHHDDSRNNSLQLLLRSPSGEPIGGRGGLRAVMAVYPSPNRSLLARNQKSRDEDHVVPKKATLDQPG